MFGHQTPESPGAAEKGGAHTSDTLADITERAIELATKAAERASQAASDARVVATPVMRQAALQGAATLSEAAERAALLFADAAERLANSSTDAGLANGSGHKATPVAVKASNPRKHRKWPYALLGGALVAGAVVAYLSPLADELRDRLLLTDDDDEEDEDEDEAITLPSDELESGSGMAEEVVGEPAHAEHHRSASKHHSHEGSAEDRN